MALAAEQTDAAVGTWQRIVDAAMARFEHHPPHKVSLRHIAGDVGVSLGTLSHYFPDRQALLDACLSQMYAHFEPLAGEAIMEMASGRPLEEVLGRFTPRIFDEARRHRGLILLRIERIFANDLSVYDKDPLHLSFIQRVADIFIATGKLSEVEARLTTQTIIQTMSRYVLASDEELMLLVDCEDAGQAIRAVQDHLVRVCLRLLGDVIGR